MGESLTAFGKRVGVSTVAVHHAVANGRIALEPDGTIDPGQAEVFVVRRRVFPKKGSKNVEGNRVALGYQAARARREEFAAQMAELEYKKRAGELLDAQEVEAAAFNHARRIRDLVQSVAARLAPVVAGLAGDQRACHDAIQAEMDAICDECGTKYKPKKGRKS